MINTQLAALLGDGRISWITYADRLMEFPTALLGVALGTVLLPSLAKHHADANTAEYSSLLDWGLRLAFLLALPAAVGLWVLAVPLVSTLYQYGRFTLDDVLQTRAALLGYSVGLLGFILVKILAPGFYARQMMKTPVKIAFVTVLVAPDAGRDPRVLVGLGHAGLTLATSLGACLNSGLVLVPARHGIYAPLPGWLQFLSKLAVAMFVLAILLVAIAGPASFRLHAGLWAKVGRLAGVVAAGAAGYFGALWLLGSGLATSAGPTRPVDRGARRNAYPRGERGATTRHAPGRRNRATPARRPKCDQLLPLRGADTPA